MEQTKMLMEMKGIRKSFGEVTANDGIDFEIRKGEIHALLGENGSGKSTLMNILTGIYTQDEGTIYIDGRKAAFRAPADSLKAGIGMVHQHVRLVEVLSGEENIIAGAEQRFFINRKKLGGDIGEIITKCGFQLDCRNKVYQMSIGEKQTVEIIKVLFRGARILVLDEPTAVLTPQETKALFDILLNLKSQGASIILITHKLNEVMEISDRVTVLRKGNRIFSSKTVATNKTELAEKMVGKKLERYEKKSTTEKRTGDPLLEIKNLSVENQYGQQLLAGVSLEIYPGEIHGIAGIAGSGQKELCEAVAGLTKIKTGEILLKGRRITGMSPAAQRKQNIRIGFIPEDRLGLGLVGGLGIADNFKMRSFHKRRRFICDTAAAERTAEDLIAKYDISAADPYQPVRNLSGGNMQKVLLARELSLKPELLLTAYPVRGLDVGAADFVYRLLNQEKEKGRGILFVGEDLDVMLNYCDRISVLHRGKVMATLEASAVDKTALGLLMLGYEGEASI